MIFAGSLVYRFCKGIDMINKYSPDFPLKVCKDRKPDTPVGKIIRLCIVFLLCFTTLQGCGSTRIERLEFELYKTTSHLDRLESKIDMLTWSVFQPTGLSKTVLDSDIRREQLEKLVVDLKAQISRLQEQK